MGWTDKGIEGGKQGVRLVTHARGCRCLVCMPMGGSGEDWAGQMGRLVHIALRWGRASGAERRVLGLGLRQALLDVYGEEIPMEYAEIAAGMEREGAVDVGAGWHRNYEQRIQDMWGRMVAGWEKAGMVEDGYWQGWANAVEEICVIVADADEEIGRMRAEIGLLKGRGVRDGIEDAGVVRRLGMLRGENG